MLDEIKTFPGSPHPLGFSLQGENTNFALFSSNGTEVILVLFNGIKTKELSLQRTDNIWHIGIRNLPCGSEYAFRVKGPYEPQKGLLFNEEEYLADPYTKVPSTSPIWGKGIQSTKSQCIEPASFDWQGINRPQIAKKDLIIYEMHVRGFTQHPSSLVSQKGTFLGIIEKIPYLKKLGVNAVELMPIFEFDEIIDGGRVNYWGYSPLYYFAPMRRFSFKDPISEFKLLVRELHKNGIEILLDVVYNHTGETKDLKSYVNFRGIDNTVYYMIGKSGNYLDFSNCFNTFNVNHPVVIRFILDSLHYWVTEMGVDGFRFDLASIFHRQCNDGHPMEDSPLLKAIHADPILKQVKLIAEPWDATGLYELGKFASYDNWTEWNGLYRDITRQFLKGTDGFAGKFAEVICGSQSVYSSSSPLSSINFITIHDGFSLRDLVSYQNKRNIANKEMNKDGSDHNDNWNCGVEGESLNPSILALRERQMRNFFLALFLSQGIPMMKMGDEYGHTSLGNNNPYVQDNEISWFLWDELKKQTVIFHFIASLIQFRKKHTCFNYSHFLTDNEIEWHGEADRPDWGSSSRFVAFTLKGIHPIYVAFNADHMTKTLQLPKELMWKQIVKTENAWANHHFNDPENGETISSIELIPYSAFVAKGSSLKENRLI